jgi:hypothetical protein
MTREPKSLQHNSERDPKPVASEFQLASSTHFEDCDVCACTRLHTLVFLVSALLHFQGNVGTVLSALAACIATFF